MKKRFIEKILTYSLVGLSLSTTLSLKAFANTNEEVNVNKIDTVLVDSSPRNVIGSRNGLNTPLLDVANFGGYGYKDSAGNYWVAVGSEFNFAVNSYMKKESGVYPTANVIDIWDGSTSRIVTSTFNGSSTSNSANTAFNDHFTLNRVNTYRSSFTYTNFLTSIYYMTAKQHGKTYEGWFTGKYGNNQHAWKNTYQKIKTDGVNPWVRYLNEDVTWQKTKPFVLRTNATDGDSGIRSFSYHMSGMENIPWTDTAVGTSFTINKEGQTNISIKAYDNVWNMGMVSTCVRIDTVPPEITSLYLSNTAWTSGNATINVGIKEDTSGVAIKKWASGNQSKSYFASAGNTFSGNSFEVASNGTYTVYVKDNAGHETIKTINVSNIDRTAPSGNAWIENVSATGFDVVVNNLSDSQSGVNRVEICAWRDGWNVDGKWQTDYRSNGTARFRVNTSDYSGKAGNYYIDVRVFDNVGNGQSPIKHLSVNVPYPNVYSSSLVISNHEYQNGNVYWVKSGDAFTAKSYGYTNPESLKYKINREFILARSEGAGDFSNFKAFMSIIPDNLGNWVNHSDMRISTDNYNTSLRFGSGSYSVRTEGSWVDTYFNLILDGNEAVKLSPLVRIESEGQVIDSDWYASSVIVKSDSEAPTISLSASPNKTWSNSNVTISIGVSDGRSGVRNWTVRRKVDNGNWINLNDKSTSVILSEDGTHIIEVTAIDNVGNSRTQSITVKVDKTAPTITLTPSTTNWTNGNITVTANISDSLSGVSIKKWATGNRDKAYFASAGETLGTSFTATSNQTYTVYSKDVAGNEAVKTITIGKIDRNPPSITGNLDNGWVKGNKVISFTATDDLSGISAIKLWNEAKTSILKTGTVNNNIGTLTHTITAEGITRYKIEAIDNASNSTTSNVTVRIDNTAPTTSIVMPTITDKRTIEITLNNLVDNHSGVKEVWVSEKSDFSSGVTKQSLTGLTTKKFNFTLGSKNTMESHFSNRPVYIRVYDNVGNYTNYTRNVKLIPKKPSVPIIDTPREDVLYVKGEDVILSWTYNSEDADLGRLPQLRAEIELIHKNGADNGSDIVYNYIVDGEIFEMKLNDLEFGDYEVKVKVYNYLDPSVFAESAVRKFRFNSFKEDGNVFTKDITTTSPIKFISVLTKYELPKGAKIEGRIYYEVNSSGEFNTSKFKTFEITDKFSTRGIIELPTRVTKLKVEYKLKRSTTDKFISPLVDNIIVLAK